MRRTCWQRPHRATTSAPAAAASQNGADCSSGTGTVAALTAVTASRRRHRARRCRPTCSRARAAPPRCARRARVPGAAPGACSSNCTGTRGQAVAAVLERHLADVVVGHHLRDRRAAPRPPARAPTVRRSRRSSAFHSSKVRAANTSSSAAAHASALRTARVVVGEARDPRRDRVGRPTRRTAPSTDRTRGTRAGCGGRPSCGTSPTSGLTITRPCGARGAAPCSAARTSDDSVHIAVASSDTSTTEPSPVCAPPKQRGGDAEGESHAAVAVAERAALGRSGSRGRAG